MVLERKEEEENIHEKPSQSGMRIFVLKYAENRLGELSGGEVRERGVVINIESIPP